MGRDRKAPCMHDNDLHVPTTPTIRGIYKRRTRCVPKGKADSDRDLSMSCSPKGDELLPGLLGTFK
jgi:hypothetical protein